MLVDGAVDHVDSEYALLHLRAAGGTIHVAHAPMALGARLRLRILARDVSLALSKPADSSVLNQLAATVVAVWPADTAAHVIVRLDAGGTPLLARITRRSHDQLGLDIGKSVWAQVKAVALLSLRGSA